MSQLKKLNYIANTCLNRWKHDLTQQFYDFKSGLLKWATGSVGRRWERDFGGDLSPQDTYYSIFLILICMIPASMIAFASSDVQWRVMARFFGTPLQAVISGFLACSFIFLGSHVNKAPKPFSVAFKLMLRCMSVYPLLVFLSFHPIAQAISTLLFGLVVVRSVQKTFVMKIENTFLFFGMIYFVFFLLQAQSALKTDAPRHKSSFLESRDR